MSEIDFQEKYKTIANCDNCIARGDEFCLNSHREACNKYIPSNLVLLELIKELYKLNSDK